MRLDEALIDLPGASYSLGMAHFESLRIHESPPELRSQIAGFASEMLASACEIPGDTRKLIRDLLRQGGFKPSGRNRPASEYLVNDLATRGSFNFINNLVDINNLLSLRHFLPMSVLDAGVFFGQVHLRFGVSGERYVFNPSGQELDLNGLLLVADMRDGESIPLGSPVKDSMAGKLTTDTKSALVVVYSHPRITTEAQMEAILNEWRELTTRYASAEGITIRIVRHEER